jgi:hypothetical protein
MANPPGWVIPTLGRGTKLSHRRAADVHPRQLVKKVDDCASRAASSAVAMPLSLELVEDALDVANGERRRADN